MSHTGQKFSEKNFFVKGYNLILKYCFHLSYTKFLYQILSICTSLLSADIYNDQKADEKVHTFLHKKQKRKKN